MNVKFAGVLPALLPILVAYVSHEMIQQLFDRLIESFSTTVGGWGLSETIVTTLAVLLGAVASGIVAEYKKIREAQILAGGETPTATGVQRGPTAPPRPTVSVPAKPNPFWLGY